MINAITLQNSEKVVLVNLEDFDNLSRFRWYCSEVSGLSYARRYSKDKTIYMHREIMGVTDPNIEVDHIDRNGLNNTRTNLRLVSSTINQFNTRIRTDNTSGFRGVSWHIPTQMWITRIRIKGTNTHLGLFKTPEEASEVYQRKLQEIQKEKYRYD